MHKFYLGCAVWGYKEWVGELFPPGSKSTDFLSLYSRRLTTTEGNTTFYATPLRTYALLGDPLTRARALNPERAYLPMVRR